jgi:uridylate kinase
VVARPVVASIGGSILAGTEPKPESLRRYAQMLDDKCPMPLGLVVGGGAPARRYIETARALGLDETGLDSLGITVTRANAWLMVAALAGSAYPHPAKDFEEAALALRSFPRVIMGGTHPGHTTDAVAAMLAERVRAERLVIVTNVDGVYTADPKKEPKAKLMEHVGAAELVQIAGTARGAGSTGVVDPLAAQLILRSRMPTRVCNGTDLDNVANALTGKSFKGTTVQPAKA